MHTRSRGYQAETVAIQRYEDHGRALLDRNFTIPGGEIDCIFTKAYDDERIYLFVEVKDVTALDDIHDYITVKKRRHARNTMYQYVRKNACKGMLRYDVVFIKHQNIYTVIENIVDF